MSIEKQDYKGEKEHYYVHKHGLLYIVCFSYLQQAMASFWTSRKDSEWLDENQAHTHAKLLNENLKK